MPPKINNEGRARGEEPVQTSGQETPPAETVAPESNPASDAPTAEPPPEPTPGAKATLDEEAGKAKKRLAETLRAAREARVNDPNVLGTLENAFEDAKNALAGNRVTRDILAAAAKALQTGAHALANHSGTPPGILQIAREAAKATQQALENLA